VSLLSGARLPAVEDNKKKLDHGVFVPLKLMYPSADVPVVQLSLLKGLDPQVHVNVGVALAPLRKAGVLIICSGSATHDHSFKLRAPQAKEFVRALTGAIELEADQRVQRVLKWDQLPSAKAAHPEADHIAPLFVAVGAAGDSKAESICDMWAGGVLSLKSFRFG